LRDSAPKKEIPVKSDKALASVTEILGLSTKGNGDDIRRQTLLS
jgi:hypothetical protein